MSLPKTGQQTKRVWNRSSVRVLLSHSDEAVERAVLYIYSQQTASERANGLTTEKNDRGFNAADADLGKYLADWILNPKNPSKPRHLSGKWIVKAREMIKKYAGQLTEYANSDARLRKTVTHNTSKG